MSMEVSGRCENSYLEKLQPNQQKKAEEAAKSEKQESKLENVPIPKDEYISSEKSGEKPSGLYRIGRDDEGNPKVIYDDPEKVKKNAQSAEETTTNTDKVDREIKQLKEEKKQLEQQLKAAADDAEKTKELERKIAQIENELSQKDNDTYRRQNAVIS